MNDAHKIHSKTQATETASRMVAWWHAMSQDVEGHNSKCEICQKSRPSLKKTVSKWPAADIGERIYIDRLGPHQIALTRSVAVDAGSGSIEALLTDDSNLQDLEYQKRSNL